MASLQSTCLAVKPDAPPPLVPTAKPIRIVGLKSSDFGSPKWAEARERRRRRMRKRGPHIKGGQRLFRDEENPLTCRHKVCLGQKKKDPGTGDTREYRYFRVDCGSCDTCQYRRLRKWMERDLEVLATWGCVYSLQLRTDQEREKTKKRIKTADGVSFRVARLRGGTQVFTNIWVPGGVRVTDVAEYLKRFYGTHADATAHNVSTSYHRSAKLSPETLTTEEVPIAPLGKVTPQDTDDEAVTGFESDTVDRDDPAVMMAATLDAIEAKVEADPLSSGKSHTELLELGRTVTQSGVHVASMSPDDWATPSKYGTASTEPKPTPSEPKPIEPKPTKRVSIWEQPKPVREGFIYLASQYGGTSRETRVSGAYIVEVPQENANEFENVAFLRDKEVAPKPCTCPAGSSGSCERHPKRKTSGECYGAAS